MEQLKSDAKKKFPNGTVISYMPETTQEWDMDAMLIEYQDYFKNGVMHQEGDTVFDVGANIGLFSLAVYDKCRGNINIYAFEPIPTLFDMLKVNFEPISSPKINAYPIGISDKSGSETFSFYPNAPCLSTYDSNHINNELKELLDNSSNDQQNTENNRFERVRKILELRTLFKESLVECQVKTLSAVIAENNIQKIDLIKIDVNGSELDIVSGINEADWVKFKQFVIKVPQGGEKLTKIVDILKTHNFQNITVEETEADLDSIAFFLVYATR